jgi:uncharacterized repeat protein (TIGR01451 family)
MKILSAMGKRRLITLLAILVLPVGSWAQEGGTGETIYVTNFNGGQVLKVVDDGSGNGTTVLNTTAGQLPEGIVVGPDGKIYVFDPDNSNIRRIDPTCEVPCVEIVYTQDEALDPPSGPEGGSFNTNGDLYFNTRGGPETHTGVWKITSAQLKGPLPATPTNVLTAAQTGSTFGEGTTFDLSDNLLVVDASGGRVLRSAPPYTSATPIINEGAGSAPVGVAVNGAGDIFLANNLAHNIVHYGPLGGDPIEVYASFTDPAFYLKFDASGRLYVATTVDAAVGTGKLWRIDPPGGADCEGCVHLVVDFSLVAEADGLNSISTPGVALAPTTFTTAQMPVSPGTTTTFNGNFIKETLVLPGNAVMNGTAFKAASFIQQAPADFNSARLAVVQTQNPNWSGGTTPIPDAAAGTVCIPIAGASGNCVVVRDLCFNSSHNPIIPCDIIAPTAPIQLIYDYNTQVPQPNPALIIADDNQNNWADITTGAIVDCCKISGGTKGINTDTTIVERGGPLPGPADLAIAMIGGVRVETGENLTYFIGVADFGPNPALATVTDTLPPNTTLVSAGFTPESCFDFFGIPICPIVPPANLCIPSADGGSVNCYLGKLAAGNHHNGAIIRITVKVSAFPGTSITDTATVIGVSADPNLKNNTTKWSTKVTAENDKD